MSSDRTHRLVPFLSGAALAIILDTTAQFYKSRIETKDALEAKPAEMITAVPAQKPGVVSREPQAQAQAQEQQQPTVQEIRQPQPSPRRQTTPMPSSKDIDAALTRALGRRGLELADLDRIESLRSLVAKLRSARAGTDGRDVEAALEKILPEIDRATLTHDLLTQKLERVRRVLTQSESAMEKERFVALQGRYLDAKTELSGLESAARHGAFAVKLAELLKDIRAAKATQRE